MRLRERHEVVEAVNKTTLISFVHDRVSTSLVPSLFPDRMKLWESVKDTKELKDFISLAADRYIDYFNEYSKGKEKYANLYLAWLNYIHSFTCRSQQTLRTLCTLTILFKKPDKTIKPATQRTVIACVLHSVQEGMQSQMAAKIETFQLEPTEAESQADDTTLYRISGWALKSTIDNTAKLLKQDELNFDTLQQLELLHSLKRPNTAKDSLPLGAQYIDRGGLTFMHSHLLPWLQAIEASMKVNHDGYKKYGKNIFSITKESVVKDCTLLSSFMQAVQQLHPTPHTGTAEQVHQILLSKIYNARSNEFLRGITKLSCIKNNKAVDVNIGLRDQLKCYAAGKQTNNTD